MRVLGCADRACRLTRPGKPAALSGVCPAPGACGTPLTGSPRIVPQSRGRFATRRETRVEQSASRARTLGLRLSSRGPWFAVRRGCAEVQGGTPGRCGCLTRPLWLRSGLRPWPGRPRGGRLVAQERGRPAYRRPLDQPISGVCPAPGACWTPRTPPARTGRPRQQTDHPEASERGRYRSNVSRVVRPGQSGGGCALIPGCGPKLRRTTSGFPGRPGKPAALRPPQPPGASRRGRSAPR